MAFPRSQFGSTRSPAFTLVEMIIVMTILSILSVAALIDYGLSIKKARLQIAVEDLLSLFHEGEVFAQSRYIDVNEDPDDGAIYCWAVEVTLSDEPRLLQVPWEESTQVCSMDFAAAEESRSFNWHPQLAIDGMDWATSSASAGTLEGSAEWMVFLFVPPEGQMEVYLDSSAPTLLEDVSLIHLFFSYGGSDEASLTKLVEITPVTSRFVVTPGGAEAS